MFKKHINFNCINYKRDSHKVKRWLKKDEKIKNYTNKEPDESRNPIIVKLIYPMKSKLIIKK